MNKPLTAGIVGATGYTGGELVRLIERHPRMRLAWATSENEAGGVVRGAAGLRYSRAEDVDASRVDVVFTCLPTGESAPWALSARKAGARVVDLSADLRPGRPVAVPAGAGATAAGNGGAGAVGAGGSLPAGAAPAPAVNGGVEDAVYGLPELWRAEVAGSSLVANPGCYPTGVLLALGPLVREGVVDGSRPVIVDAASGVTGAGRTARRDLLFGEVAEDYRAYGAGNVHRHLPELEAGLVRAGGGRAPDLVFTPHLLPVRRGILETIYIPAAEGLGASDLMSILNGAYAGEPFIELWGAELPSIGAAVGRNVVVMGAVDVRGVSSPLVICVVALDNLLKGAAGQALQNANLMLGLPETEGIPC